MQDRQFEDRTFPAPLPWQQFKRPLVLAPHPDDEIFGCAGLMALWCRHGVTPQVIVLTDGQEQSSSAAHASRRAESMAAAAIVGHAVTFWGLPDRGLRCSEDLMQRLREAVQAHAPDVILCPDPHEPHPDHQATALALLWVMAGHPHPVDVCFYESGGTLAHCSHLVDITAVTACKNEALQTFTSQESAQPYRSRIMARDHFRALPLGPQAQAAEGFQYLPIAQVGWPAIVPMLDALFLHQRGLATLPEDIPLVSVLTRTIGDPLLEQAVACVFAQTYARIELIVVAAHGAHAPPQALAGKDLRWISQGQKLSRPVAANVALDAAQGQYCIFLDDDDLIAPQHIEKLVHALQRNPEACAAHTNVQVLDMNGKELLRYDRPYCAQRLVGSNVFPIHSVLFARSLVTALGCRFDEALPVLEDWDFWLQVSEHSTFIHVPGVSAIYRYRDRSALQNSAHVHHQAKWRAMVYSKWLSRWPQQNVADALAWYAAQLDHGEQSLAHARKEYATQAEQWQQRLQNMEAALAHSQNERVKYISDADTARAQAQAAHDAMELAQNEAENAHRALARILASRSWRLLEPARRLRRLVRGSAE